MRVNPGDAGPQDKRSAVEGNGAEPAEERHSLIFKSKKDHEKFERKEPPKKNAWKLCGK